MSERGSRVRLDGQTPGMQGMKEIAVGKEKQDGTVVLTFRFKALGELLDGDDPTPLPGTELTDVAEDAISGYLDEYWVSTKASLVLEVPERDLGQESSTLIVEAIRRHFGFRILDLTHDLKIARREGSYSLIVAVGNVAVLVLLAVYVTRTGIPFDTLYAALLLGFLTILNWVTIWHTYEHFVYTYRDLNRRRRIFQKITRIPITLRGF
jgi:hypothetical protein